MGISGLKSKLRKSSGKPEGWYKITGAAWDERTMQSSGIDFILLALQGERAKDGGEEEILLFLGKSDKVGEYVRVEDGQLISTDSEDEYEINENSGVGRFLGSVGTVVGKADKATKKTWEAILDEIGVAPGGLAGTFIHFVQEDVLDRDGNIKKNDAGYDLSNTLADKVGTEKEFKAAGGTVSAGAKGKAKTTSKPAPASKKGRGKAAAEEEEDEEEEEEEDEPDEEEDDDQDEDEDEDEDDEEDDDEDEPAPPPARRGAAKAKKR